jgi:hypothetical protein
MLSLTRYVANRSIRDTHISSDATSEASSRGAACRLRVLDTDCSFRWFLGEGAK